MIRRAQEKLKTKPPITCCLYETNMQIAAQHKANHQKQYGNLHHASKPANLSAIDPSLLAQFNLKPEERLHAIRKQEQEQKLLEEQKAEAEKLKELKARRVLVDKQLQELTQEYY